MMLLHEITDGIEQLRRCPDVWHNDDIWEQSIANSLPALSALYDQVPKGDR
ncbi:MAG: hypothetical protein AABY13_04475 [Nanoarchaeota archaeon]